MVNEDILLELELMKDRRINIRVSEPYLRRLYSIKTRTGISISEMVRRGLVMYLNRYEV